MYLTYITLHGTWLVTAKPVEPAYLIKNELEWENSRDS